MNLLIISEDMSYHFKFLDLVNKKAFDYLNNNGFIDEEKFLKWWFCKLKDLKKFNNDSV